MNFLFNKNQVFSTKYYVYTYNDNYFRIVKHKYIRNKGFELISNSNDDIDYNSDNVKNASLSRTKRNIREICLCNDFSYFATLTINSQMCDRYSLNDVQDRLKKTLKKLKRKYNDFKYIFITEKHKDGAFHFHGLIGGLPSSAFVINTNGFLELPIISNEMGFNSFSLIKDYNRCCNYITKYITKDCIKNSHNQIYISSRGLKKATREEFKHIDFIPSFSNDYCDILDVYISDTKKNDLMNLFFQLKEGI